MSLNGAKPYTPEQREAQFWTRVDKNGPGGCWLYTGAKKQDGYGLMGAHRRTVLAHRYSWELVNGPIPEGKCALHHCDVRACVNPAHLYLGDRKDNARDCHARGRHAWGRNKLKPTDIPVIRSLFKRTGSRRSNALELAQQYGVTKATITSAVSGKTWRKV